MAFELAKPCSAKYLSIYCQGKVTSAMIAMALAISMTTMRVDMRTMMAMAATIVTTSLEVIQEVETTPLIEE